MKHVFIAVVVYSIFKIVRFIDRFIILVDPTFSRLLYLAIECFVAVVISSKRLWRSPFTKTLFMKKSL